MVGESSRGAMISVLGDEQEKSDSNQQQQKIFVWDIEIGGELSTTAAAADVVSGFQTHRH